MEREVRFILRDFFHPVLKHGFSPKILLRHATLFILARSNGVLLHEHLLGGAFLYGGQDLGR